MTEKFRNYAVEKAAFENKMSPPGTVTYVNLITAEEHNLLAMEKYKAVKPKNSGVECPVCGKEMLFVDGIVINSWPPKRTVVCPFGHANSTIIV